MDKQIKKADCGGEDSGSMSPEAVMARKKMTDAGKTEGEAVMKWLKDNEDKNKPKKASSDEIKKLSKTLGRPV